MDEVANKFPAKTEGHGGEHPGADRSWPTAPRSVDLTAKIVDWEVEPGKIVKAWTYNGAVPGPEIQVDVGDKVRIVLKNDLPESTSLHLHGVRVPNTMDGVDPYTQPADQAGRELHLRVRGARAGRGHVPLAPRRPDPDPERHGRRAADRRDADPRELGRQGLHAGRPAGEHGAQRLPAPSGCRSTARPSRPPSPTRCGSARSCWSTTTTRASRRTRCTCTSRMGWIIAKDG